MNIMSLDAAYGDGTITDMHAVPPPEAAVDAPPEYGEPQKRAPVNPKIRPMQQLDDNVLNLSGFSKLTPANDAPGHGPAQGHGQGPPQGHGQGPAQGHGQGGHGQGSAQGQAGHVQAYPPAYHQGPPPPPPTRALEHGHGQGRAPLPHPQEFLNAAPVPSDHLLEQQLQDKLLEQYRNEPSGAGGADAPPVHGLRSSGSGSRFAKYGDGDAGEGRENESSLAAFYARNKIVILVTGVIFCVLLGVLIWVLVCHRKKKAAQALLPAAGPPHFGAAGVPPYVGPVVFDNISNGADSVLSWEGEA
jgi:hypothetical protein